MNIIDRQIEAKIKYQQLIEIDLEKLIAVDSWPKDNDGIVRLATEIWQLLDKATNLALELWTLGLKSEAGRLENLKIDLRKMHNAIGLRSKGSS